MPEIIEAMRERVVRARQIADELRHDDRLHKLAMASVFVLEDSLETLIRLGESAAGIIT